MHELTGSLLQCNQCSLFCILSLFISLFYVDLDPNISQKVPGAARHLSITPIYFPSPRVPLSLLPHLQVDRPWIP